ncbi:hypothetical protein EPO05_00405 [Patescibacteria group bacterium]|nr:MAG: hypothetical protein EPO05_00405 [Patescibacteria group bacterium]
MPWKLPPQIKIYEALGCIGDGRIELIGEGAKVYSSSGQKFYTVNYDAQQQAIMANDNGSYWQGYLGYPAIAYLLKAGIIKFNSIYAEALRGIAWKDINTQFKNDFEKTVSQVHEMLLGKGIELDSFTQEIVSIHQQLAKLGLSLLGNKMKPPSGY